MQSTQPHSYRRIFHILPLLMAVILLLNLPGCGLYNKYFKKEKVGQQIDKTVPPSADSLVQKGIKAFNNGKYHDALETFQNIRDRYPFSQPGLVAELKSADCNYYLKRYSEALLLYNEFKNSHPTNEAIPYIIFQKGMCHYKRIDTVDRDPSGAHDAIQSFSRLLRAYPDSPYTEEAQARVKAARDFLAKHELYVVDFFMNTKSYKQAEGRLLYLLDTYPDSSVAPTAEELLALLKAGTPPETNWRDWIPEISIPDWETFRHLGFGAGSD